MERALLKASTKLERPPNDRFKSRLARRVMKLFDDGMRDDDVIASAAVFQERIVEGVIQKN
ncbi:hypothetical protein [Phyllobacterium lublinensis]|uniref:hypothetical protein n=1 Tax=Phyllobacterium lublinensis TaxID=2875708 RepID=UPI001CCB9D3E|nr:hypothetical protein [Phyllobacterium sp. 2063]MBZ9653666.1 hypothetical protein [Phyllobacterium sp. 2063]